MIDFDLADVLYYSDDPETVHNTVDGHGEGVLFDFDIVPQQQTRFLFYHVNGNPTERFILVRLFNTTARVQTVEYVASLPPGSSQYINVGHAATASFVRALVNQDWRGVNVAPNDNFVVVSTALTRSELAVGVVEFRQASGPIRCSLLVCNDLSTVAAVARGGRTFKADGKFRRGKFALAPLRHPLLVNYDTSQGPIPVKIGIRQVTNEQSKPDGSPGQALKGEYGVFTHLSAALTNSDPIPKKVALYESARGGASTATYVTDGRVVESGAMRSPNSPPRYKVATYNLAPHQMTTTSVITIPDAGSSSPIEVTVDVDDDSADPGAVGSIVTTGPTVG